MEGNNGHDRSSIASSDQTRVKTTLDVKYITE